MKTAEFFAQHSADADIEAARRLLLRDGGQPPEPRDRVDNDTGRSKLEVAARLCRYCSRIFPYAEKETSAIDLMTAARIRTDQMEMAIKSLREADIGSVEALRKLNATTLGFFPYEALREHLRNGLYWA